jgi:hypothetical protein
MNFCQCIKKGRLLGFRFSSLMNWTHVRFHTLAFRAVQGSLCNWHSCIPHGRVNAHMQLMQAEI